MKRAPRISPRRPLVVPPDFGVLVPGWPMHRQGRSGRRSGEPILEADRHFRVEKSTQPVQHSEAPINLSVANFKLSPRFSVIWNEWNIAAERLRQPLKSGITTSRTETWGTHNIRDRVRASYFHTESLLERVHRALAGPPSFSRSAEVSKPRHGGLTAALSKLRFRAVMQDEDAGPSRTSKAARVHGDAVEQRTGRYGTTEHHALRHIISTVTRRNLGVEPVEIGEAQITKSNRKDWRSRPSTGDTVAPRTRSLQQTDAPTSVSAPAKRLFAQQPSAALANEPTTTRMSRSAAERTFRSPDRQSQPERQPEIPRRVHKPQEPKIDIARLDAQLWQRFQKRLRIERERRGRG